MDKDKKLTGQSEEGSFSTKLAILFEFTTALKENLNSLDSKPIIWASQSTTKNCPILCEFSPSFLTHAHLKLHGRILVLMKKYVLF